MLAVLRFRFSLRLPALRGFAAARRGSQMALTGSPGQPGVAAADREACLSMAASPLFPERSIVRGRVERDHSCGLFRRSPGAEIPFPLVPFTQGHKGRPATFLLRYPAGSRWPQEDTVWAPRGLLCVSRKPCCTASEFRCSVETTQPPGGVDGSS